MMGVCLVIAIHLAGFDGCHLSDFKHAHASVGMAPGGAAYYI
jgi:hypothetical protein